MVPLETQHALAAGAAILCILLGHLFFTTFITTSGVKSLRLSTEVALARELHEVLVPTRSRGGLAEMLYDLNQILPDLKKDNVFVTWVGVRLVPGGAVTFSLAGHLPILHYRKATGRVERLQVTHLPLGILPTEEFTAGHTSLAAGDVLALLTDGLTEVANRRETELGMKAWKASWPTRPRSSRWRPSLIRSWRRWLVMDGGGTIRPSCWCGPSRRASRPAIGPTEAWRAESAASPAAENHAYRSRSLRHPRATRCDRDAFVLSCAIRGEPATVTAGSGLFR